MEPLIISTWSVSRISRILPLKEVAGRVFWGGLGGAGLGGAGLGGCIGGWEDIEAYLDFVRARRSRGGGMGSKEGKGAEGGWGGGGMGSDEM